MFCDYGKKMNSMLRGLTYSVRMGLITALLWLVSIGTAPAAIINQPMTGTSAPGWVFGGALGLPPVQNGYVPFLTAGAPVNDGNGNGWLRLTDTQNDEAGYAYYSATPFDMSQGIIIQFDYATWGGNGADGYSVYLFDAAKLPSFNIGASGGSLGYAQKLISGGAPNNVPGISGGYVGIGIDEFGNFANGTEGRYGGPGSSPSTVTVRGPVDALGTLDTQSYPWLQTSLNKGAIAIVGAGARPDQTGLNYRKVVIRISPAPNPVINVWIQFGANQPLTQMIYAQPILDANNQPVSPPANVVIGYAASTGGATNNHEIRNLVVDNINTDIDLSITDTPSTTSIAPNNALVYTVVARNNGPNSTTANGTGISVTIPPQLTGVTWSCTPAGGAVCGAGSIAGNTLTSSANLPFNGTATYTITGTVATGTPIGTLLNSMATLTVPAGIIDYNPSNNSATAAVVTVNNTGTTTISGIVYSDVNHNGVYDTGDNASTAVNGIYVAAIPVGGGAAICSTAQASATTGAYTINVPVNNTYTLILTNAACSTTSSFPNVQWVYTSPVNYTYTNVGVGSTPLANQNFGIFNGTLFSGRVFQDDGTGGGTANNGIQDGLEVPMQGVTLTFSNNGTGNYGTATTDGNGNYALYVAWGSGFNSGTGRITQTFPSPPYGGFINVNYNKGTLGGTPTFSSTGKYVNFTYARGTDATGINFGNVPANTFTPTPLAANCTASSSVYYAHAFTPGSGGSVTFSATGRSQGSWPAVVYYLDANCSGSYQAGDAVISSAIVTTAGTPICILVKDTVPPGATNGTTDVITTTAAFTYTNSPGPVTNSLTVTDTTTVVAPASLTIVKSASPSPKVNPGQVVTYTLLVTNTGTGVATNVAVTDSLSPYTYFGVNSYGAGVPFQFTPASSGLVLGTPVYSNNNGVTWSYGPLTSGGGGAPVGYDANVTNWTIPLTGSMAAGSNFTINFMVQVK